MLGSRQDHPHYRSLAVATATMLVLLVGLAAIVLMQGSATLPASNAAAECVTAPAGPTARGYGETGAGVVGGTECDSSQPPRGDVPDAPHPGPGPGPAPKPGGRGDSGDSPCPPGERLPQESGRPNAREDDETGRGGDTAAAACVPCPSDSRAPGLSDRNGSGGDSGSSSSTRDDNAVGPTGRGYGESGASGVMVPPPADDECPTERSSSTTTGGPTTGGGGAHDGRVPGATGRAAPTSTTAKESAEEGALREPLVAASVGQTSGDDAGRKNTALVVGGLVLLLVAVAVVLRRGRPGSAR